MKKITNDQIELLKERFENDDISIENLEDEIEAWLKWDTLEGLDAREFEMNYALKHRKWMGL